MSTPLPSIDSLTPEEIRVMCAEKLGISNRWVLMKRGLYYRPEGHGYTGAIEEAWIINEEEANRHVYPHDEPVTKHPAPLPDYPGSADAALTLCTWMSTTGWRTEITIRTGRWSEPDKQFVCVFVSCPLERTVRYEDDTLAMAIARAFCVANGLAQ